MIGERCGAQVPQGTTNHPMLNVLELFAGIGGCAEAFRTREPGVPPVRCQAFDISTIARDVYRENFSHRATVCTLEALPDSAWDATAADLWWMSPPCQPYTHQGRRRDLGDPRAAAFVAVLRQLARVRPPYLALENVPGFVDSQSHAALREVLERSGYDYRECLLCPTELGWPMRRRRYYLVASRGGPLRERSRRPAPPTTVRLLLEQTRAAGREEMGDGEMELPRAGATWQPPFAEDQLLERHRDHLHVLELDDPGEVARCFTSAYGKSPLRSGSYLRETDGRLRHLTPTEVLGLMGFSPDFRWPSHVSCRQAWSLAGNSLAIPAVREVLTWLPGCDFA